MITLAQLIQHISGQGRGRRINRKVTLLNRLAHYVTHAIDRVTDARD